MLRSKTPKTPSSRCRKLDRRYVKAVGATQAPSGPKDLCPQTEAQKMALYTGIHGACRNSDGYLVVPRANHVRGGKNRCANAFIRASRS